MTFIKRNFSSNALWSLAGGGISALTAVAAIPALIYLLGVDKFALVSLLISLNLFFFVYDFGLTRAMHFFSPKTEHQPADGAGSLIGSALTVAMIVGVVVTLMIIFVSPFFTTNWLKHTGELANAITKAFQISALGIVPALISNVIKGNLEGRMEFKKANLAKMFSGVSLFVAPVGMAMINDSIVMLAIAMMLTRVVSFALYYYLLLRLIRPHYFTISYNILKNISAFAFWAGISGFFATLFIYGDRFIVAGFISSTDLSIYIASQDVLIRYLLVPWSLAIVLSPYFSSDNVVLGSFKTAYLKAMNSIKVLTLCFIIVVSLAVTFLIPVLVDNQLVKLSTQINYIMIIGIVFASFAQLPLIFLYARGKARLITVIFVFEGGSYLLMAPFVFDEFGALGAACVWSARLVIEFMLLNYFAKRILQRA